MRARSFVFLSLLILTAISLPAENLRGTGKGELLPDAPVTTLAIEDFVTLPLPPPSPFFKALELEIQVPREVLAYRYAFAAYLYQNLKAVKPGNTWTAERVLLEPIPPASKFFIQIPLQAEAGLKSSFNTAVVKNPPAQGDFPLALTFLPIEKGLPTEAQGALFQVRSRIVNANLGGLSLSFPHLSVEQRKNLKINAGEISLAADAVAYLPPGLYDITVTLPGIGAVTLKAGITQGKVLELPVVLEEAKPEILIEAPEGSTIILDGKKLSDLDPLVPLAVEIGSHNILFILGNYQINKVFEVTKGGRHKVSLLLDISFEEN